MSTMLPSAPWLNITFVLALCLTVSIFTIVAANSLRGNNANRKLVRILVIFSLSVAVLSSVYGYVLSGGALAQWHFLGFPEKDDPVVRIVEVGYVETRSGNIYYFTGADREDGNWAEGRWEQVDKVVKKQFYLPSPGTCGTLPFLPLLRQNIIDSKSACVITIRRTRAKIVYALDSDGSVYSWWNDIDEFGGDVAIGPWFVDFWFVTIERVLFLTGGIASCALGIIILSLVLFLGFLRKKMQKHNRQIDPVE